MAALEGQQLGSYRLLRLLGQGGFADVYLGEHIHLTTQAAIKVLHTQVAANELEHLLQEARTIARLAHPHIIGVLDFGVEHGTPFLVMRYAPGGSLRQRFPRGIPVSAGAIAPVIRQAADALQFAHDQRLIHRDVKPENLLLGPNNEVLLSDFGIALLSHTSRSMGTQEAVGTVIYMAPEQLQGHPRPASDQYALAVVAYEWLTGDRLFQGSFTEVASQHLFVAPPPLRQRVPTLSPLVEQVVLTALAKKPEERFGSVRAFATALEQAAQSAPTALFAPTQVPPAAPWPIQPASTPPALTTLPGQAAQPPLAFAPTQVRSPSAPGGSALTPPSSGGQRVSGPLAPTQVSTSLPPNAAGSAPTPPFSGSQTFTGGLRRSGPLAPVTPGLPAAPPRRKGRTLLFVVLVLLVLAGSGSALVVWVRSGGLATLPGGATPTPAAITGVGSVPPQGKRGGTVVDGLLQEPDSLLSNGSLESFAALVDATIWAPLLYGDAQGSLHPGLLREVPTLANGDIAADARQYTLKLRAGLQWSDGQPLTSEDVVYTLNLWNTPAYRAANTLYLPSLDFTTLVAVDVTTISFRLKQPFSPFLALQLTDPQMAPLPKHVFGAMDPASILQSTENVQPQVVSGPFQIQERVKGDHISLVRNPHYYQTAQGYPYLDRLIFKIIPDSNAILTALQSGQIDTAWSLDLNKLDSYKTISGYTLLATNPSIFEELLFNLHNPILADLQVRKAISMSIDLDTILRVVRKETAQRTCDEAVGSFAHDAHATCYPFDPAGARQVLDADGWVLGADGFRHKAGKTLALRWSTTAGSVLRQQTELIAQANLKDVGMQITILNYPAGTFFGTVLPRGEFDLGEYANQLGYDPDNPSVWLCNETPEKGTGGSNWGFYCNPAVDQAIATEETNPNQTARQAAFQTFQQAVLNDLPVIYLYAYGPLAIARQTLHNYQPSGNGPGETWNVWQWWLG